MVKMDEPYTQSLLLWAYQATAREVTDALHRAGHTAIRPKHGAVFANLDRDGTRASVLAERAGIGRAAMGELIDELERLGYVERRPDPDDRRAKRVVPTAAALDVTGRVHAVNVAIEQRWQALLGARAYRSLRAMLRRLAPEGVQQPRIR